MKGEKMLKKFLFVILLFPAISFCSSEGSRLVNRFWRNVQHKHMHAISHQMTSDYQSLSSSGAVSKKQELTNLALIPITSFQIYNVFEKRNKVRLDVIYELAILNGTSVSRYHQMSVYEKKDGKWRLCTTSFIPFGQL